MATAGQKLQNLTECSICFNTFNDPRSLPCIHTFCLQCLEDTRRSGNKKPGENMLCPLCRKMFAIPVNGLSSLPKNFFVESLKDVTSMLESSKKSKEVSRKRKSDSPTAEIDIRQTIQTNVLKISNYAEEVLAKEKILEQKKKRVLSIIADTERKIRQRNEELKKIIDRQTESLLEKLNQIKENQIREFDNEESEIQCTYTILKSFESYCNEVMTSKGSASDISSSASELITRAAELEKDTEAFIGRPSQSTDIFYQPNDLEVLLDSSSGNIVGHIHEETSYFESSVIIAGLSDGTNATNEVIKLNLHRSNEISTEQQMPTTMRHSSAAAVYCNTLYVIGIGNNFDEIWSYKDASVWVKCASLVQGRSRHCAEFMDKILYICGGYVNSDGSVLDSVEAYDTVGNTCKFVGKLVHCVQCSGNCVSFKSSLYIFGGTDNCNALNCVQMYDTKQNVCTLLSKPMPSYQSLMRAVRLPWQTSDSVILIGCYTSFIFNFETETWLERKQFKTDVAHFGLALENGRIFVIGGGMTVTDQAGNTSWKCRDDIRCIPIKSVFEDKPVEWKYYAKLEKPAMINAYGKIMFSGIR